MNRLEKNMPPCHKIFVFLLSLMVLGLLSARQGLAASLFTPYIEKKAIGWIDWDEGYIYGIGRGDIDQNGGSKQRAIGAASLLASGNILKLAAELNVDDKKTLQEIGGGRVVIELKAFLRDQEYSNKLITGAKSYYEIIHKAPLHGVTGITAKLISQTGEGPVHTLPAVTRGAEESAAAEDSLPWLVFDARKLGGSRALSPAFFPKVVGERGAAVYQLGDVDRQVLANRGMARYVSSSASLSQIQQYSASGFGAFQFFRKMQFVQEAYAAEKSPPRSKREQYIVVDVKGTEGLKNTNMVVSEADAFRLRADDNATKILQKCRVMVLVSGKVGGVEGRVGQQPIYAALAP